MPFRYNEKEQSSNLKLIDYSRERDAGVPLLPLNAVYNRVADAPEISIRTNQKLATSGIETDKDYKIKVHAGHVSARGLSIYIIHQHAIRTRVYAMYSAGADSKRLLGRKFDDEFVSRYRCQKDIQFSLKRGDDDEVIYQVNVQGQLVTKTPEAVSAEILKYLRNMASEYLGKDVAEVVISIPAYFSNAQRKATKRAVELAELKLLKFITEPSAGALHYVQDRKIAAKLLVFDWGGGTLDVSLINVRNTMFEVESVYGDTLLGGRNIDYTLFRHFYRPVDEKFNRRLLSKCEDLKKHISSLDEYSVWIECYDGSRDLELSLTREQFDDLNENIFQTAIDIVEHGLDDAGWKKSEVHQVILVGGSTRIPKIRELLSQLFERKILKTDLNPDEAVAIGACLQAAMLKNEFANVEKYKITEVTPLSLGINGYGNLMTVIVKRNTRLPVKLSTTLRTVHNNQNSVLFQIVEGERKNCKYNNELGTFSISGLPRKRAGDVHFTVIFHLDEDGVLTVTASENYTGRTNHLIVTLGEFRLSQQKVKGTLKGAAQRKCEDDAFEAFVEKWSKMREKCEHIIYDSSTICLVSERDRVEKKCQQFLEYSENLNFTEMDDLERKFKTLYNSVSPILMKNRLEALANH